MLSQALNNLASLHASRDLAGAQAAAREGLEVARRAGIVGLLDYNALNLTISLWLAGRLLEAAELVDDARDWMSLPLLRLWMPALGNRIAAARGLPLTKAPEAPTGGGSQEFAAWADHAIQLAMAGGEYERALDLAEQSLPHVVAFSGIDDDFIVLWPPMVLAAVAAGDVERAERMLAPVETAGAGIVSPALAAEWHWLRGLVLALRGDPPAEVEAELRTGIAALEAFGAIGLRAQAQEDLARWLVAQGRAPEAEPLVVAARMTYEQIGADGWLAALSAWSVTAVPA